MDILKKEADSSGELKEIKYYYPGYSSLGELSDDLETPEVSALEKGALQRSVYASLNVINRGTLEMRAF